MSNIKSQTCSKSPQILKDDRKKNILEEYRQKEIEETRNYEEKTPTHEKPFLNPIKKPIEKMSPIMNLLTQERNFMNAYEKTSAVKKLDQDQTKHLGNFFKEKEMFTQIRNAPNLKKDWSYLKTPGSLIRNNDENVFYKNGLEKVNEEILGLNYLKILLVCFVIFIAVFFGMFLYHFYQADVEIFCDDKSKFIQQNCVKCPLYGRCVDGLLVKIKKSLFCF